MNKNQYLYTMQFSKKNCTMQSSTTAHTYTHVHTHMGEQLVLFHRVLLGRTPHLVLCSAAAVLKFLIIFEQGILHFHFALDPANYVARPTYMHTLTQTHTVSICICVWRRRDPSPIHTLRAKLWLFTGVSQVIHQVIQVNGWRDGTDSMNYLWMRHNQTSLPVSL